MSPPIVVVIRDDPFHSPRAVEALRIALGLGAGESPVTVVLMDQAVNLVSEERDDIADVDILEKYLPSFQQLETEFLVPTGTIGRIQLEPGLSVQERSMDELLRVCTSTNRVLVF